MHAVIVDGDVSYPATSGKRLRTLHLMLRLAERHRLTYIGRVTAATAKTKEARQFLGDHGIETILVDDPLPAKSGLAFHGRLAANLLLSDLPYSIASHRSLPMRRASVFAVRFVPAMVPTTYERVSGASQSGRGTADRWPGPNRSPARTPPLRSQGTPRGQTTNDRPRHSWPDRHSARPAPNRNSSSPPRQPRGELPRVR